MRKVCKCDLSILLDLEQEVLLSCIVEQHAVSVELGRVNKQLHEITSYNKKAQHASLVRLMRDVRGLDSKGMLVRALHAFKYDFVAYIADNYNEHRLSKDVIYKLLLEQTQKDRNAPAMGVLSLLDRLGTSERRKSELASAACTTGNLPLLRALQNAGLELNAWQVGAASDFDTAIRLAQQSPVSALNALTGAAAAGHLVLVRELVRYLDCAADDAVQAAATSGHWDVVRHLLEENRGEAVTQAGHLAAIFFAAVNNRWDVLQWCGRKHGLRRRDVCDYVLMGAAEGGHVQLLVRALLGGAKALNMAMYAASKAGHLQVVELLAPHCDNYEACLTAACHGGCADVAQFMLRRGARDWNSAMFWAAAGGHHDLVQHLIEKGACHWGLGFVGAVYSGDMQIVALFASKGACDYARGLVVARECGHECLLEYLEQKLCDGSHL